MKAIVFERAGEASEVLELREIDAPLSTPSHVVVEVEARSMHPADLAFVLGRYRVKPVFPQVAGLCGAGRVVDAGGSPLARGTRVAFRWPGAWAERVLVPVQSTFVVPEGISLEDAAQFALNPITAWGLLDAASVKRGDVLGLTAPASSVAALARALAEARGIGVVDIDRAGLGAEAKDTLTALLDCVGGPLLESLFPALRQGATLVTYGTLSPEPARVHNATIVYSNLVWKGFGIDRWLGALAPQERAAMVDALWQGIREGALRLPVHARFALRDFASARLAMNERTAGKVLLV